jgi:hypothetical protein
MWKSEDREGVIMVSEVFRKFFPILPEGFESLQDLRCDEDGVTKWRYRRIAETPLGVALEESWTSDGIGGYSYVFLKSAVDSYSDEELVSKLEIEGSTTVQSTDEYRIVNFGFTS